ncbi:MAG TPA: orotate phosphoribosyltransferase [Tepidisphaeraceae bacterium]|jgi:orotate phosphoribosyltransferase
MTRTDLARRIAEVALLRGEFTLRSGRKSNYYLDKYRFETQPDVLVALGKLLAEHVTAKTDRIAGAELGAVPLAAAAGMAANKPIVFIRNQKKDYGTARQLEGVINAGESILIVEDILTTGGQVLEAAKTIREAGCTVEKIVGVIDRLEGARENIEREGFTLETLFTIRDLGIE